MPQCANISGDLGALIFYFYQKKVGGTVAQTVILA
jgi:hypothetical protein|tara:strand:- start:12 stop:116 length:105 start_codon:yes stop_codon:yes gene_type:complete